MTDRLLPQSDRAEKGTLSAMLQLPQRAIDEVIQAQVTPEHFHHPAHADMFRGIVEMKTKGKTIDAITFTDHLEAKGHLDNVGGAAAVTEIFYFTPSPSTLPEYLETLKEMHLRRQVIQTAWNAAQRAFDLQDPIEDVTSETEASLRGICETKEEKKDRSIQDLAMGALDEVERLYRTKGAITGVATGLKGLDDMTNGLQGGQMFVIAARPSMGKTALALNIAENVAVEQDRPVSVYTLEMGDQELVTRMLCSRAALDVKTVRSGYMPHGGLQKLQSETARIGASKLQIFDRTGVTIQQLRSHARRIASRHNTCLIVIDYLQLVKATPRGDGFNRQSEVAEISTNVKAMAKELNIPVIVLAQLNRNPDARQNSNGRPKLSDLRESGSIEQDADIVGLLWREEYYLDGEEKKDVEGKTELIIAKQRNGAVGDIPLTFIKNITRFEDRALTAVESLNQ